MLFLKQRCAFNSLFPLNKWNLENMFKAQHGILYKTRWLYRITSKLNVLKI